MSPRGGTLPGNRKGPPHNARTVALLLEVSEAQRQAIPKTYRFSVLVSLRLPITTLIATAHRATACETGSSDRHHADTEHHYCGVVDQRHKVIEALQLLLTRNPPQTREGLSSAYAFSMEVRLGLMIICRWIVVLRLFLYRRECPSYGHHFVCDSR